MLALDSGADDVSNEEDYYEIVTKPEMLHTVAKAFEDAGLEVASSEVNYVPQNEIELDKDAAVSISKLVVALEDLDDVQNVYTNANLDFLD